MEDKIPGVISDLSDVLTDIKEHFGGLSEEQLNWKLATDSWSVAQCLDHLIRTNSEMLPAIDIKINGAKNSFWENWSPLTGFFGRFLTKSMRTDSKKFKAPSKSIVPPSEVPADIVDQFAANQAVVIEKINAISVLEWDKVVITSPFMGLITYRVADGINILVEHEKRHVRQARRVMETEGFPS